MSFATYGCWHPCYILEFKMDEKMPETLEYNKRSCGINIFGSCQDKEEENRKLLRDYNEKVVELR